MNQEQRSKKQEKRPHFLLQFLTMGLYVLAGVGCSKIFLKHMNVAYGISDFVILCVEMVLVICVDFLLHMLVHEAGHLVCGLVTGYRFSSFRIGSLMFVRTEGKLKIKRYSLPGTAGQCLMAPPYMVDGRIPYILYNLGGSLFNLLFSLVAFLVSLPLGNFPLVMSCLQTLAVVGIVVAWVNGIPMQVDMVNNDGYNALCLGKYPKELRAFWIQMKVMEQIAEGVRLKDMPDEWFDLPTEEDVKNPMCAAIAVLACNRLMDSMRLQEAAELMEKLLNMETGMTQLHRRILSEDCIYCELVGENRLSKVLEFWCEEQLDFEKKMNCHPSVLRSQYAFNLLCRIAQIEEKPSLFIEPDKPSRKCKPSVHPGDELARKCKKQFEKCARTYPYTGEVESQRELMAYTDVQKERLRARIRLEKSGENE